MKITLETTLLEILKLIADEKVNPIIADFSNFGYENKVLKFEIIDTNEVEE